MGLFGGKSSKTVTNIDKEKITNSVKNIMQYSTIKAMVNNQQSMSAIISAVNVVSFANVECNTFTVSGIEQKNVLEYVDKSKMSASVSNELTSSMASTMTDSLLNRKSQVGTNIGDVAGKAIDAAADIAGEAAGVFKNGMDNMFGGKSSSKYNLKESEIFNLEENVSQTMEQVMNTETIQEAVSSARAENELLFEDIRCTVGTVSDIAQTNMLHVTIEKIVKSETMNNAATELTNKLESFVENIDENRGDIAALADGMIGVIDTAGDTVEAVADDVASVANNAVDEVGETTRHGMDSATYVFIALGLFAMIAFVAGLYILLSNPEGVSAVGNAASKTKP
jgi:hypothetical protein